MKPTIVVTAPVRIESEANKRGHWAKKSPRTAKQRAIAKMVLGAPRRLSWPVAVRLVRIAPCRLDDDNLARAFKATRDGVADWIGIDDRDPRVTWHCDQERGGVRVYGARIELFEGAAWRTVLEGCCA